MSFEGTGSPWMAGGQVGRQVCKLSADGAHPALGCLHHTWPDTRMQPYTMSSTHTKTLYIQIDGHLYLSIYNTHVNIYTVYKSPEIPEGEIWGFEMPSLLPTAPSSLSH